MSIRQVNFFQIHGKEGQMAEKYVVIVAATLKPKVTFILDDNTFLLKIIILSLF